MTKGFKDYVYTIPYFYRDHVHLMNLTSAYSKHSEHKNGKEYLKQLKELNDKVGRRVSSVTLGGFYNLLVMSMFNRSAELTDEEIMDLQREKEETSKRALRLSVWENFKTEKPTLWDKCKEFLQSWL